MAADTGESSSIAIPDGSLEIEPAGPGDRGAAAAQQLFDRIFDADPLLAP